MSSRRHDRDDEEPEFIVENILEKKIKCNKVYYLLKWKGYPDSDNTWEPADNLEDCRDLIRDFEEKLKRKSKGLLSDKAGGSHSGGLFCGSTSAGGKRRVAALGTAGGEQQTAMKQRGTTGKTSTGFDRGLEVERIIGMTSQAGSREIRFVIKWQGCDEADLVPARVANAKCPQAVIRFYEERITWDTVS
ncbi:chromobox protein homolog 1-like isoform X2 [Varroa jacobsoni]|uniref:Chromo domain-containing protein n=1 Tax=Varroa destructor TaxID=109461 RepID=A0A7M7MDD1_VARDE|nr:chromobox protein homolog 1-like isoform X2 [Varroa destructor]XP_022700132.1 chromobox protein homolog 1-like isoform X2 [Varroa jacobsoni]